MVKPQLKGFRSGKVEVTPNEVARVLAMNKLDRRKYALSLLEKQLEQKADDFDMRLEREISNLKRKIALKEAA
jgi:hypothetical protein